MPRMFKFRRKEVDINRFKESLSFNLNASEKLQEAINHKRQMKICERKKKRNIPLKVGLLDLFLLLAWDRQKINTWWMTKAHLKILHLPPLGIHGPQSSVHMRPAMRITVIMKSLKRKMMMMLATQIRKELTVPQRCKTSKFLGQMKKARLHQFWPKLKKFRRLSLLVSAC